MQRCSYRLYHHPLEGRIFPGTPRAIVSLLTGLAAPFMAAAAPVEWTAQNAGFWTTPSNWSSGVVPNSADADVSFSSASGDYWLVDLGFADFAVGSLTFSGAGTYGIHRGVLSVSHGIFQESSAPTPLYWPIKLGDSELILGGNGTGTLSITGALTGTGTIRKQGTSHAELTSNSSTVTGPVIVEQGTLTVHQQAGLGTATHNTTVLSGATLNLYAGVGSTTVYHEPLNLSGTGVDGKGALQLTGRFSVYYVWNGSTYVPIYSADGSTQASGAVTLAGQTRIGSWGMVDSRLTHTLDGQISGAADLEFVGNQSLKLSAGNTYTGSTSILSGTVSVTNLSALGTSAGAVAISGGAVTGTRGKLELDGGSSPARTIYGGRDFALSNGGGLGGRNYEVTSAITLTGGGWIGGTNALISGPITGTGGLTIGAGSVELTTGNKTFTGPLTLEGTLRLTDPALLSGRNLVLNGGVLGLAAGNFTGTRGTGNNQLQWLGSGGFAALGGDRTAGVGTSATWNSGSFVPSGSALLLGSSFADGMLNFTTNIALGSSQREVRVDNGSAVTDAQLSGIISGSGSLVKSGSGTLLLTAENSFSGGLYIDNGIVEINAFGGDVDEQDGPVGRGKVFLRGGTLRYTRNSTGDTNRLGTGSLISSSEIEITNAAADLLIDGTFSSTNTYSTLTKRGPGALSLAGSGGNTNLNVEVSAGRLDLEKSGTGFAVNDLTIYQGGLARVTGASTSQIRGLATIYGTLELYGATQVLSATDGYGGTIANGHATTAATLTLRPDSSYEYNYWTGTLENGGAAALGVTMDDFYDTYYLRGVNTYSGTTQIRSGGLVFEYAASLSPNSNLYLNGGSGEGNTGTAVLGFDLTRSLGTGAGQIRFGAASISGLAAYGGTRVVNIGGNTTPATLTRGAANFLGNDGVLSFGQEYATGIIQFQNPMSISGARHLLGAIRSYNFIPGDVVGELNGALLGGTGLEVDGQNGSVNGFYFDYDVPFLRLTADNTFNGPVIVAGAGVEIDRIGNINSGAGPLGTATTLANSGIYLDNAVLRYKGSGHSTDRPVLLYNNDFETVGYLDASGTGAWHLYGNVDLNDSTSTNAATLVLTGTSTAGNEIHGAILHEDEIFPHLGKSGPGTWRTSGEAHLSSVTVREGSLTIAGEWNYFRPTTTTLTSEGTGKLQISGNIALYDGDHHATLELAGSSTAGNEITGNIAFTDAATDRYFSLSKIDSGAWSVTGNTTVRGLTVHAGLLRLGGSLFLNADTMTVKNSGTLRLDAPAVSLLGGRTAFTTTVENGGSLHFSGASYSFSGALNLAGSGADNAGALRNLTGDNTQRGLVTLAASTKITADAGSTLTFDVSSGNAMTGATTNQTLTLGGAGEIVVADPIVLPGSSGLLTYSGSGSLALDAANTIGSTQILSGEVIAGTTGALGSGAAVVAGGTLRVEAGVNLPNAPLLSAGAQVVYEVDSGANLAGLRVTASGSMQSATIRSGQADAAGEIEFRFAPAPAHPAANDVMRASAVLSLDGTDSAPFVLQLAVASPLAGNSSLGWYSAASGGWLDAVANNGAAGLFAGHYAMSWDAFRASHAAAPLSDLLGAHGVDTANGAVWAVIDHNSEFAVIPEPCTAALLAFGAGLAFSRRRKRVG